MNKSMIIIICLVGIILLLNAVYFPQLHKERWGNNDLLTGVDNEYGLQVECDYSLWQPPVDCKLTDSAQKTLDILLENGLASGHSVPLASDKLTHNKDMTDWWADMIESLDGESSAVWTEPGWEGKVWVVIDDIGDDTYRISLHGITAAGSPITYTITETEDGYHKYGPMLQNGTMDSRFYINEAATTGPVP